MRHHHRPGSFLGKTIKRICEGGKLGKGEEKHVFFSFFTRFFVTLDKLLHLGMKKEQVLFVLLSFFRNFVRIRRISLNYDFRMSVENHYCSAYGVWYKEELVAIYALSFDSLDLDSDDKEELETGISSTGTPNVDWNYKETFYAKPRYPALDIAYLAVREEYRGNKVGQ